MAALRNQKKFHPVLPPNNPQQLPEHVYRELLRVAVALEAVADANIYNLEGGGSGTEYNFTDFELDEGNSQ